MSTGSPILVVDNVEKIYAGGRTRFIDLFYVPIWSFLHWVLVASPRGDAEVLASATQAHALAASGHKIGHARTFIPARHDRGRSRLGR